MTPTILFLVLVASPPRTMFHAELGQDCSTISAPIAWTDGSGRSEIQAHTTIGPMPFGEVRYLCWDGVLVTIEAKFSPASGRGIRNSLSRRWGQSSYEPWVDIYSWHDDDTMARLDYTDDGVLTISDRSLLMGWRRARTPGLYGMNSDGHEMGE